MYLAKYIQDQFSKLMTFNQLYIYIYIYIYNMYILDGVRQRKLLSFKFHSNNTHT